MSGFIPDIWSTRILNELKKRKNLYDLTDRDYQSFAKGGSVVIPHLDNINIQDETAAEFTLQKTNNKNDSRITIDKQAVATIGVGVVEQSQANQSLLGRYAVKAANQMGRSIDIRVAKMMLLEANTKKAFGEFVSSSTRLTKSVVLAAAEEFNGAELPQEDRNLVVDAAGLKDLLDISDFVDYNKIAYTADKSPLASGLIGKIFGFDVFLFAAQPKVNSTGVIATEGNDKNTCAFFQKEAFATVIGLNALAKSAYSTQFGQDVVQIFTSYGIKALDPKGIIALRK